MVKKIRRVRTFARTAAKSMEKKLVENAKKLREDPFLILPDYEDKYSIKYFKKVRKGLEKVNRFKDDIKKLEKLSNKRGLDGALAGTLILSHSEKAPYLAVAKFNDEDISYAQRGRADKEKLIGVQYFDNPVLRLLSIKDVAQKRRLNIYSWDNGFISTGLKACPPKDFIDFLVKKIDLTYSDKLLSCEHIKPDTLKAGELIERNYLKIYWKSAELMIGICEDCSKLFDNTIFKISKYLIQSDLSDDFSIDVIGQVVKKGVTESTQTQNKKEYLSGELSDVEFIRKNMEQREESIRGSGEKILILDGVSYGTNLNQFIDALKPNRFEREGLKIILEKIQEPIVFNNVTPNKVLERYWKDNGFGAINSIINNEEMAKKFFSLDDTPSEILQLVFNFKERQKILMQLPKYKALPPLAKFIDAVVKTYKTFGEREAIVEIKKRPDDPKGKSIAYAFLLVFGKALDKKWQYTPVEIEYGEFLREYAEKLLNSEPNNYQKALQELLTISGSSENIDGNLI